MSKLVNKYKWCVLAKWALDNQDYELAEALKNQLWNRPAFQKMNPMEVVGKCYWGCVNEYAIIDLLRLLNYDVQDNSLQDSLLGCDATDEEFSEASKADITINGVAYDIKTNDWSGDCDHKLHPNKFKHIIYPERIATRLTGRLVLKHYDTNTREYVLNVLGKPSGWFINIKKMWDARFKNESL